MVVATHVSTNAILCCTIPLERDAETSKKGEGRM